MQYTRKSDGATVDARPVKSTAYNPTRHQAAKPGEKNTWSAVDEEIEGIGKVPVGHMVVTDENGKITCPSDAAFKELYEPAVAATTPAVPAKRGAGT
jgi:hypothetical protein